MSATNDDGCGAKPLHSAIGFLSSLGFVGLESIELALLVALVTGDPLLLVGGPGCAKSAVVGAIARALGLSYWAYSALFSAFEDLVGFPDPFQLQATGRIGYARTPLSIAGKEMILVDEISRASPSTANRWLEIIRARSLMGERVESLQYVVAAMNPVGHLGTRPLDAALLGRFALIVSMPETRDMERAQLLELAGRLSVDDAPLARELLRDPHGAPSPFDLPSFLVRARERLPDVVQRCDAPVRDYAVRLTMAMGANGRALDGRRLAMLRRNLLTALAIDEVLREERGLPPLRSGSRAHEALFEHVMLQSLPSAAEELPPSRAALVAMHATAYGPAFAGEPSTADAITHVLAAATLPELLDRYERSLGSLGASDHHEVLTRVVGAFSAREPEARACAVVALARLTEVVMAQAQGTMPPDVIVRAMEAYWEQCSPAGLTLGEAGSGQDVGSLLGKRAASHLLDEAPADPAQYEQIQATFLRAVQNEVVYARRQRRAEREGER